MERKDNRSLVVLSEVKQIRQMEQLYTGMHQVLKPDKEIITGTKEVINYLKKLPVTSQEDIILLAQHFNLMEKEVELKKIRNGDNANNQTIFKIADHSFINISHDQSVRLNRKENNTDLMFTINRVKKSGSLLEKLAYLVSEEELVCFSLLTAKYTVRKESRDYLYETVQVTRKLEKSDEFLSDACHRLEFLIQHKRKAIKVMFGLEQYPDEAIETYIDYFVRTHSLNELTPDNFLMYIAENKELLELPYFCMQYPKALGLGKVTFEHGEILGSDTTDEKNDPVKLLAYQLSSHK